MGVYCGHGPCVDCDFNNDRYHDEHRNCFQEVEIYTGKDYELEVLRVIVEIYSDYSIRQIKSSHKKKWSLSVMKALSGHHAMFSNDIDSIWYVASTIVMIQQHAFRLCSESDRLEAYRIMHRLKLTLDKQMRRDRAKVVRKYKKGVLA